MRRCPPKAERDLCFSLALGYTVSGLAHIRCFMNRNIKSSLLDIRHGDAKRVAWSMVVVIIFVDDVVPLRLRGLFADKDSRVSCCLGHSAEWVLDKHVATTVPCTADGYCADTCNDSRCTIHRANMRLKVGQR